MEQKKYDWNKANEEINLRDYFTYKFPHFFLARDKHHFVDNHDPSLRSDKYDFWKKDGVWLYKSRHSLNGGNFVEFVKKEVAKGNQNWQKVINEELEHFFPVQFEVMERNKHLPVEDYTKKKDYVKFELNGSLLSIFRIHLQFITEYRQISVNTINSPEFKDVVKTYNANGKKSYCIGIPLINKTSEIVGLNRIFTYKDSELFNQKKFLPGSDNTIGFSKSNTLEKTEKFIICEGVWDGMAHYELKQPKNAEYIFSNGELGRTKAQEIMDYISDRNVKNIELANDNDLRGSIFNLILLSYMFPNLKLKSSSKDVITISIINGERVSAPKLDNMLNHFLNKNNDIVKTIRDHNGNDKMLEPSDLFIYSKKEDSNDIEISLPNQKHFIEEFNDFALHIFSQQEFKIQITKAESKDFNDDLKKEKKEFLLQSIPELLSNVIPSGELTGVPKEIIEKMLYYQVQQGNTLSLDVFEKEIIEVKGAGGIEWDKPATEEGYEFWDKVIVGKEYDVFFSHYPELKYDNIQLDKK